MELTKGKKFQLAVMGSMFMLVTVVDGSLLKYYTDIVGIRPTIFGKVVSILSVFGMFNMIWGGILTDIKGKYIEIMRYTIPISAVLSVGLLLVQPTWSTPLLYAVLFAIIFVNDISKMLFAANANVFVMNVLSSSEDRTSVSVWRQVVSFFPAGVASYLPILVLTGDMSRPSIILVFVGCIILGVVITEFSLRGLRSDMVVKSKNEKPITFRDLWDTAKMVVRSPIYLFMMLALVLMQALSSMYYQGYLYYMDNVINVSGIKAIIPDVAGAAVQFAVFAVLVKLVSRFGSRDTLRMGLMVTIAAYAGLIFVNNYVVIAVLYALVMTGFASVWGLVQPISGLIADMEELESGKRKAGTLAAFIGMLTIPTLNMLTLLFTTLLEKVGYDGSSSVQAPETVVGLRYVIGGIPIVVTGLAVLFLSILPFNKKKEKMVNAAIEERRIEEGTEETLDEQDSMVSEDSSTEDGKHASGE
ncbi:MAG: MFS transporter [Spirochaetales bacterium]|nr:MFS transporter [Spirochaetales bacterium]